MSQWENLAKYGAINSNCESSFSSPSTLQETSNVSDINTAKINTRDDTTQTTAKPGMQARANLVDKELITIGTENRLSQ